MSTIFEIDGLKKRLKARLEKIASHWIHSEDEVVRECRLALSEVERVRALKSSGLKKDIGEEIFPSIILLLDSMDETSRGVVLTAVLEKFIHEYFTETGRLPKSVEELIEWYREKEGKGSPSS